MTFLGIDLSRAATIAEFSLVLAGVLVAVLTALVFHLNKRVTTADALARSAFETDAKRAITMAEARAAEAYENAGHANERTARLEVEAAAQRERAARAERELLELKKRLAPRTLSDAQAAALVSALAGRPKGPVLIQHPSDDHEGSAFAHQIDDALKRAGWKSSVVLTIGGVYGEGIELQQTETGPGIPHVQALYEALTTAGLTVGTAHDAKVPVGSARLIVAHKP